MEARAPLFAIWNALLEERAGLHYPASNEQVLFEKLGDRAAEVGFDSLLDYYYFLRYDPASAPEFEALIESLVVRETYFFREVEALDFIARSLVPEALRAGRRARVWSAACSTGEEPITLAMLLAERGLLDSAELLASDLSSVALARAQAGRFGRRSLREPFDAERARRWLVPEGNGYRAKPELVRAIAWRRINLAHADEVATVPPCDAILCRNVFIYFAEKTVVRVVESLGDRLVPGGALFVGVSESLMRMGTSLEAHEQGSVFFYRRRAG